MDFFNAFGKILGKNDSFGVPALVTLEVFIEAKIHSSPSGPKEPAFLLRRLHDIPLRPLLTRPETPARLFFYSSTAIIRFGELEA
jgi:hypothetical protein